MNKKQYFEVLGYKTKSDFEYRIYDEISEYLAKHEAIKMQNNCIKTGNWYAVKVQSTDREYIKIEYYTTAQTIS